MDSDRVPNEDLGQAALDLMAQAGKPLERTKASGRSMIYKTPSGETVRLRTSNDHVLIALADSPDPASARLNVEGTDFVLIVMPERQRTPGKVVAYLVPTSVVVEAVRSGHRAWLEGNPNTKGANRTWNLWFNDNGPAASNSFAAKWQKYRLPGVGTTVHETRASTELPVSKPTATPVKLSGVIGWAKEQIADAAGVSIDKVKISIEV